MKPLNDYLLIKADKKADNTTSSGLIIGDGKEKIQDRGEVLKIGPNVLQIEVGQTVFFRKYSVEPIKFDDVDMLMVQEADVLGIIE